MGFGRWTFWREHSFVSLDKHKTEFQPWAPAWPAGAEFQLLSPTYPLWVPAAQPLLTAPAEFPFFELQRGELAFVVVVIFMQHSYVFIVSGRKGRN